MMLVSMLAFTGCKPKVQEGEVTEEPAPVAEPAPVDTVDAPAKTAPVTK